MTLQDLGALGELVGGVAVIASVLYLAIQIRHGMNGYRSTITQEVTSHFSRMQLEIAKSPDLLAAWVKAQRHEALEPLEQQAVTHIVSSYMIGFENLYFQYRAGMLEQDAYRARQVVIKLVLKSAGSLQWWREFGMHQHPEEFVAEVNALINSTE